MSSTTDPSALSGDVLLAAYDAWLLAERLARMDDRPLRRSSPAFRAELLRRLEVYDRQRCGPPDPT